MFSLNVSFPVGFPPLNHFVTVFPIQGQGQPRGIIYINFLELESPMIHAKFQDNRTSGSGEDDFLRFSMYTHAL